MALCGQFFEYGVTLLVIDGTFMFKPYPVLTQR
jgi:hypothetical protein